MVPVVSIAHEDADRQQDQRNENNGPIFRHRLLRFVRARRYASVPPKQ